MNNIIENYRSVSKEIGCIWRNDKYDMDRPADIARYVARIRYSFPGGYSLYAITDDGGTLCADCCRSEYWQIAHSNPGDGWHVIALDIETEYQDLNEPDCDPDYEPNYCSHCSEQIG